MGASGSILLSGLHLPRVSLGHSTDDIIANNVAASKMPLSANPCKYRLVLLYDGEVNFPRSDFPLEGKRPLLKKPTEFKSQ